MIGDYETYRDQAVINYFDVHQENDSSSWMIEIVEFSIVGE